MFSAFLFWVPMLTFFLVLHFIVAVLLVLIILVQKGDDGGALGVGGGGGDGAFSPRGQANLLTRVTTALAVLFMVNCIVIANLVTSSGGHARPVATRGSADAGK